MKSEILFREKLAAQHVSGEVMVPGYIEKVDHDALMHERVRTTGTAMKNLQDQGVSLSPFIEAGAERGQRALVLANDFNAEGFALDLSFAQLKTLDYWMEFFNKPRGPVRVVCDVYKLPFQANSIDFSFCYQFLHHFPSPKPVIEEIYRVMAGGYFFFDEEPYKRFTLGLYRRKVGNTPGKIKQYLRYMESFIAHQYETEEEYGIIENDDIPLDHWLEAVDIFPHRKIFLQSANLLHSEIAKVSNMKIRLHRMMGGGISALLKKESEIPRAAFGADDLYGLLGCPECELDNKEGERDRAPLVKLQDYFTCDKCHWKYPMVENVIFLLPKEEMNALYPEFAR